MITNYKNLLLLIEDVFKLNLMVEKKYRRVLLKFSGEQLSGDFDGGIDPKICTWLANEIKPVLKHDVEIIIMVGGGNFARGQRLAGNGIKRVTADHIGMLGTLMNALAMTDIFESEGIPTRCLSNIFATQVAEQFIHRLANKHLEKKRVIIVAGGIGRPYITTDTAAVSLALELDCQIVMKATKFDGVYDKDPERYAEALKIKKLSHKKALSNNNIKIMDKAAIGLAMDHNLPIIIFEAMKKQNILNTVMGKTSGSIIA